MTIAVVLLVGSALVVVAAPASRSIVPTRLLVADFERERIAS